MTKLAANPSAAITANGEYECASSYAPGDSVTLEVYSARGGASVQPGLVDPDGNFEPLGPAVTDAAASISWKITLGATGRPAVKIDNASGGTALKVATTPVRQ